MEINCSSVKLTTLKESMLMCAGGDTILAASLVKAPLAVSVLSQQYMKLLMNQPKMRGEKHISRPSKPVDSEDDDGDDDDDEDGEDDPNNVGEEDTNGAKNGPDGASRKVEEKGNAENDNEQEYSGEDPNDDDDDDDDDENDDDDDDDDENDDEDDVEEEDEEEEDEDEEEAQQPLKKRKK